ncbi:MAG: Maf family protein, partial [Clostridiales bacterium]|nr:Maf family protein [Clostridiales bacterium]
NDTAEHVTNKNAVIISADTVVYDDGKILGKPENEDDAYNILKSLSGRCHSVFTGICVMRKRDMFAVCKNVETKVFFKELTDENIRSYISTGEPMDKAGAYGIQGLGALLVDKIEGDFFNVVGLPVGKLAEVLKEEFDYDMFKGE